MRFSSSALGADRRHARFLLFAQGCLLGAVAFLLIFGICTLDVTWDTWLRGGFIEKDCIQHYTGWLFYRDAPLSLPLCVSPDVNWPDGLSVAFTDSIPLFAAIFRILAPLLPSVFQYFGWYVLLCFCLQGGFSALLLDRLLKNRPAVLVGSCLFVVSPIMVERAFRHTSLTAHFLIVWALYYYVRSMQEDQCFFKGAFVLNALTISLHPYFVPMVYAILFAMLVQYALRHRCWLRPAAFLLLNFAATLLSAWVFGLFSGVLSESSGQLLYGYFGMNLNALWNPTSIGTTTWSRFLPIQNQVRGNYDGFNYLGLGVLLMAACAAGIRMIQTVLRRWSPWKTLRRHGILLLVCACLTVFAVSNVVTANGATLLEIPLPLWLLRLASSFRSSGRLFWPVYYLILAYSIKTLQDVLPAKRAAILLCVVAVIQIWDISPALLERRQMLADYEQPAEFASGLQSDFWQQAAEEYDHLATLSDTTKDTLYLALWAADAGMTTDDPFAARSDQQALNTRRETTIQQLEQGQLQPDCLYLTDSEGIFLRLADQLQDQAFYAKIDGHYIIAPGMLYTGADALVYSENYPISILEYTDANWDRGVLTWDNCTVMFDDTPLLRRRLDGASAVVVDGVRYEILTVDDSDPGYIMLTLDTEDAAALRGAELEFVS